MATANAAVRRRKLGTYLMLAFTCGWILTMLSIESYQAHMHGFGSGFGDGGHVPQEIVDKVGVGSKAADVVNATVVKGSDGGFVQDGARIGFSLLVLAGITFFWFLVMSRIGTF